MPDARRLHFGYGSNISRVKLLGNLSRTDKGPAVSTRLEEIDGGRVARLSGYRFVLRRDGTANIQRTDKGTDTVCGVLYSLSAAQYERLWIFEGRGTAVETEVTLETDGAIVAAHTFCFAGDFAGAQPRHYYVELIIEAAKQRGDFPADYIERTLMPLLSRRRTKGS